MKSTDVHLNSDAHRAPFQQFREAINNACQREGWRTGEALGYFLEAGFRAMRAAVVVGEERERNESAYMKIASRCRNTQSMVDLATMLGATVQALQAAPTDFIGPMYAEFAANERAGQFFTPPALSRMVAEMSLGDLVGQVEKIRHEEGLGFILCQEPACGVGGMVLEAHAVMKSRGILPHKDAHWHMTDVDFAAMCGAYVQCNLCGVSAIVIHGNTLSGETWMATPTIAAFLHPKRAATARPVLNCAPLESGTQFGFRFQEEAK